MEAKQYDTAAEFFDLAMAAAPKQAGELALLWGIELLASDQAPARRPRSSNAASTRNCCRRDDPSFYFYLADALAMCNRPDEALAAARKAAEMKKDSARYCSHAPLVLYHAKRYDEAIADIYEAGQPLRQQIRLGRNPRDAARCAVALSELCGLKNRQAEAEEWNEQVLDEFPDDVSALNDLGYLWADAGKHLERA